MRKVRIILAWVFLLGITWLFLDFTGTAHAWLDWMAKLQFLPAVLALNVGVIVGLLVITLVLGRIYCSVICPLGILQDVFAWMGKNVRMQKCKNVKIKNAGYTYSKAKSWLRYAVLVVFVVLMVLGLGGIATLIAPYSAFGRIAQSLLQPLWMWGNNLLAMMAERADSYAFYSVDVWLKSLPVLIIAVVTVVVLFVLAWRGGRTYCNTICPVGTVLGFVSRFSLLKIHIKEDKCIKCGLCAKNCKASCIDFKNMKVDYSRCVDCFDCIGKCKKQAIGYDPYWVHGAKKAHKTDESRREFLTTTAVTLGAVALEAQAKKVDGGLAEIEDKQVPQRNTKIVPPGALSIKNLEDHCTGCQLCVSKCPNDVLRPSTDLMHLMQPEMSFERGYCRPECTACGDVCPTGAIHPITKEEKTAIKVGHAVLVRKNCVAVTTDDGCGLCATKCPTGAVMMTTVEYEGKSVYAPVVDEEKCIGCGTCEHLCPARPFAAIYVEGHEVHGSV